MDEKLYTVIGVKYREDNDIEEFDNLTREQAINKMADMEAIVDKYNKWSQIYLFEQLDWETSAEMRGEATKRSVPILAEKKLKTEEEENTRKLFLENNAKQQRLAQYKLLKDEFE